MKITIESEYKIGQLVYLKTDPEQYIRMVVAITINPNNIYYDLACAGSVSNHYDFEISAEKVIVDNGQI